MQMHPKILLAAQEGQITSETAKQIQELIESKKAPSLAVLTALNCGLEPQIIAEKLVELKTGKTTHRQFLTTIRYLARTASAEKNHPLVSQVRREQIRRRPQRRRL